MSSAILTINLKGQVIGPVKHTDKQVVSVDATPFGSKSKEYVTKKIKHNDRVQTICTRKLKLSAETVSSFQSGECPFWEKPYRWLKMSKIQRLESHLNRYDEGYGISYTLIE